MSDVTLKPAPKPFTILGTHAGSTSEVTISGLVVDGISGPVTYYKVKQGNKAKIYEADVAAKDETIAFIEECKYLSTTPLIWTKIKTIYVASPGHVPRSWRYPVIIEAYEDDIGIRLSFQQTSGARVDISLHGEASPL